MVVHPLNHVYDDVLKGEMITIKKWDRVNGNATVCWKSNRHACGQLRDFYPPCEHYSFDSRNGYHPPAVIDEISGHTFYNYWDLFTPNGTIEMTLPDGKTKVDAEWLIEISESTSFQWDCRDIFEPEHLASVMKDAEPLGLQPVHTAAPQFKNLSRVQMEIFHHLDGEIKKMEEDAKKKKAKAYKKKHPPIYHETYPAEEPDKRDTDREKRDHALFDFFSVLPPSHPSTALHRFAFDGAALVHRYVGNDSRTQQAKTMYTVMNHILEAHAEDRKTWKRWVRRRKVSGDVAVHKLLDAHIDVAHPNHKRMTQTLGMGGIMQSVRERAERGDAGWTEGQAAMKVFDRIFRTNAGSK